jgi:type I restriction enzyme, S subunit
MSAPWPRRAMAEIAPLVRRPVEVKAAESYREIGIRSFARGVFHKAPTTGLEIGEKRVFGIEPGDLLFNIVFAWEGAVAVASRAEYGMIGSHRFLTCVVNKNLADVRYLYWWFSRGEGREQLLKASPGGAGRNRTLGVDKLAAIGVPLPSLAEQRRLVSNIDGFVNSLLEVRLVREQAEVATKALIPSFLHEQFVVRSAKWKQAPMSQIAAINDKQVDPVLPAFAELPHINGENIESGTCRLLPVRTANEDGVRSKKYLFSAGSILYSKIRPYLRKAVFVDFDGVCSADVYPLRVIHKDIEPNFFKWALVADPFSTYANRLSGRTRMPKLNRSQLFAFDFTYPELSEQRRIVAELDALQSTVEAVKRLQVESRAEIDAIIPAIHDKAFQGRL